MDFYEVSSREMTKLSRTEQSIVKYVIKNMAETAQMSIRELSEKCFVSPATLFRFTKSLKRYCKKHLCRDHPWNYEFRALSGRLS